MSEYKGLFLLAGLSEEEKKKIISCLPKAVKFKKGEMVYSPESFRRAVGFVESGLVTAVTNNSQQSIMKRIPAGSCFRGGGGFRHCPMHMSAPLRRRRTRKYAL